MQSVAEPVEFVSRRRVSAVLLGYEQGAAHLL